MAIDTGVVILGLQVIVFMLFYVSLKLDREDNKWLGIFLFFAAMFLQQAVFTIMIEAVDVDLGASGDNIENQILNMYTGWSLLTTISIIYYAFILFGDLMFLLLDIDIWAKLKRRDE